jgi:hypothetical protein
MDSRLLMPDQNVLDLILFEQFVVNKQYRAARVAENMFDLFFLEAPDYNLCARQLHFRQSNQNRAKPETRNDT